MVRKSCPMEARVGVARGAAVGKPCRARGAVSAPDRTTLAAYDLPEGKAYYRSRILQFTTLDKDPAAIHAFGEAEVARLHEQMLAAMKETGFKGDFPAFLSFLRRDPRFYAKTPDGISLRFQSLPSKDLTLATLPDIAHHAAAVAAAVHVQQQDR